MKIGITYDLRDDYIKEGFSPEETAEFDSVSTIDAIDDALRSLGYMTERIGNINSLVKKLASGKTWDLVFNICEGLYGLYSRESQVPALLEAYNIPYTFSDPLTICISLKKDVTKAIVRSAGIKTPDFIVIDDEKEIDKINIAFPLFLKPIAEGTSKGVTSKSRVLTKEELKKNCVALLHDFRQPVLIEKFCTGREFTAGLVGTGDKTEYIGAIEIIMREGAEKNAYSYYNKENCEMYIEYRLVEDEALNDRLAELSKKVWTVLRCRDSGRIDFMMNENNELNFIEVNPLAGLNPEHSDLPIICSKRGIHYNDLIGRIINSASLRVGRNA